MLFFEPGSERVAELVPRSCMSTVNLAEVLGRLARDGRRLDEALDRTEQMGIVWIDFDRELAIGAAALLLPTAPGRSSISAFPSRSCAKDMRRRRANLPPIRRPLPSSS
jgi:PIN domain nuclease of toxin-antitoxin system